MIIRLDNLVKRFGSFIATDHVSLEIEDGELFTLLGPSGCGKTTLLRLIAGFYKPDSGKIYFDDDEITQIPPSARGIGMVFQNYALWPHMKVYKNLAYPLKIAKLPNQEIRSRVKKSLELVQMQGLEARYPGELSGGQQQRVALGRALAMNPTVLLLDEPLSNLDAKIRVSVRAEIRSLQKKLKITTIYVTHDQEEALTISDRIAVFSQSRIAQVGVPDEIYHSPQTSFVADFVGINNLIKGKVKQIDHGVGRAVVKTEIGEFQAAVQNELRENSPCILCIRPEEIIVTDSQPKPGTKENQNNSVMAEVDSIFFSGPSFRYHLKAANGQILKVDIGETRRHRKLPPGAEVSISFPMPSLVMIPDYPEADADQISN
jgi:ABC-type Fe3+/spermidine/putrescine transport system ATPase subunit